MANQIVLESVEGIVPLIQYYFLYSHPLQINCSISGRKLISIEMNEYLKLGFVHKLRFIRSTCKNNNNKKNR